MLARTLSRVPVLSSAFARSFSVTACNFQGVDRLYTKKHEWIAVSGTVGTVGISDFAQSELGDVVYAELPEVGAELSKGDSIGVIESVKSASDVYSPVTGKITEINDKIESTPQLINKSTYKDGWLFKVELKNAEELKELMDEAAYKEYRDQEKDEE